MLIFVLVSGPVVMQPIVAVLSCTCDNCTDTEMVVNDKRALLHTKYHYPSFNALIPCALVHYRGINFVGETFVTAKSILKITYYMVISTQTTPPVRLITTYLL